MQLQLRIVTFKCTHLDYRALFQVVKAKTVVLNLVSVLDYSGNRAYDIDYVVALIVDLVDFVASHRKLAFQAGFNYVPYEFWVRLVTNLEYVVSLNLSVKTGSCGL
jgi:hypothetical protein